MSNVSPTKSRSRRREAAVDYKPTSLDVVDELSLDEFVSLARSLGQMERSRQWWIGDLLVVGEEAFEEHDFYQAVEEFRIEPKTLMNYRYVASHVRREVRREGVSFSIHAEVAKLDAREQIRWLKLAEDESLTVLELRDRIAGREHVAAAATLDSGEDETVVARRLERIERGISNGLLLRCPSGDVTVEDLVWLVALAKRLTRGGAA